MNPFWPAVPTQFETPRLRLRAPEMSDARELLAAVQESHAELAPWLPWASADYDEAAARTVLIAAHDTREVGQAYSFFLRERATNRLLGSLALHNIEPSVPRVEIGYWLRTSAWGHGFMTEAIAPLCEIAVECLDAYRVEISCDARNEKSAALARRAGFTLEARLVNDRRNRAGLLSDTLIFARTRDEETAQ